MDGSGRSTWPSAILVVCGLVLAVIYALGDGSGLTTYKLVSYEAVAVAPVVATLFAILRYRPRAVGIWLLFAAGAFGDYLGELLWDLGWKQAGSLPDIAYFGGYLLMAMAIATVARRAHRGRDVDDTLDLVIVWVGLLILAIEFLIAPGLSHGADLFPRLVTVTYPVLGAGIVLTLVRVLADPARRVPAVYLLTTAFAVRFVTDVIYAFQDVHGTYVEGHPIDAGWMITSALLAAAVLHPSMRKMTTAPTRTGRGDGRVRLVAIGAAVVTIPVVVGILGDARTRWWTLTLVAVLDVLVMLRVARLFRWRVQAEAALERSVAQQAAIAALGRRAVEGEPVDVLTTAAMHARKHFGNSNDDIEFIEALAGMLTAASARREAEARLTHQAVHDALTGLPNRLLLLDHVESAVARSTRSNESFALLFLDLDRFKILNDSAGHGAGDQLLIDVAGRLRSCARTSDTIARFGGDEFAVLCENLIDERDALVFADRVLNALRAPFAIGGEHVVISASIGVAIGTERSTAEGLLRDADAAMYRAKETGRDRVVLFDDVMLARTTSRLTIEREMRAGMPRGELRVHYQPATVLATGAVVGYEALVRWEHPTLGLLLPSEFLDVAEETRLIVPIGELVLDQALADLAHLRAAAATDDVFVAVNLSVRQLTDTALVASVAGALARHGVDPRHLCLEITEHALARDPEKAAATLAGLGALGVKIAVDDFGTGHSSLTYLRQYPVDVLKIDRSFVSGIDIDSDDTAIVNAVITLGHALGLKVLAEGVEGPDQSAALAAAGCDWAQGYYVGTAQPIESLARTSAA